jgi:hypothetical protein
MRRTRSIVATALVGLLVTALAADARRGPRQIITAIVGGKRVKLKNKQISAPSLNGGSVAFGGGQQPHRLGQTLKGVTIGCAIGLESPIFPAFGQYCQIGYSETKFSRNLSYKQWASADDAKVHVTFESWDGTRLHGTFEGTLDPYPPGAPFGPVTVQNGSFTILFTQ